MDLDEINHLSSEKASEVFNQCCSSNRWVEQMVASRPFASIEQCKTTADNIWSTLSEQDYLEAFAGHPKIGDINSLREKYANTKALASGEQSAVNEASEETLKALATGNQQYEAKNGFIFIVCATGKSAAEMLGLLQTRLKNSRKEELKNAAYEQAKITALRIEKLLSSL